MSGELDIFKIILESGLVVKGVLLLLIVASVLSWAIVFMKKKLFSQLEESNKKFMDMYRQSRTLREAAQGAEAQPHSPYKSIFNEGYKEFTLFIEEAGEEKLKLHYEHFGLESIQRAMKKGVNSVNLEMEKKLSTLASIGSVTPFVGLFGTVWGIINSFTGLGSGGATLDAVAPGIAEALVATAVGLAAAIPAVWFFNVFNNRLSDMNTEMESFEQDLLNSIERTIL
ncbi:MAG: Tol-Pal system subunit TolQ [Halobacteriovoraceae bacterium]|nr:Tol-Pal system subunit TolQ [Halobacteriovoraceae bacterium]|tara:strand:- start:170367 stop:171047 length:681 start_codon:yes stop_codon:yes gene_type:complete